jgi:hypothetical protein
LDAQRSLSFSALSPLPDHAVRELQPGELQQYNVIRVGDEILVDLMKSAGGMEYAEAAKYIVIRTLDGVPIPFAAPRLWWRMKAVTHREKDVGDLYFSAPGLPNVVKRRRKSEPAQLPRAAGVGPAQNW